MVEALTQISDMVAARPAPLRAAALGGRESWLHLDLPAAEGSLVNEKPEV